MVLVLGIDAAWGRRNCSGVALLDHCGMSNRVICVAPSVDRFIACAEGDEISWLPGKAREPDPDIARLLRSAEHLGGCAINLVAIDMPLSNKLIVGRRTADTEVSKAFGRQGAAVHSPSSLRPGRFGQWIHRAFTAAGFALATKASDNFADSRLIEVFPLATLVRLMGLDFRPPYKVGKTATYWPGLPLTDRKNCLCSEWRKIIDFLKDEICDLDFNYPEPSMAKSLSALKPYEDGLDAIICALAGAYFFDGHADSFGDQDAAIWVPKPVRR